MKYQTQPFACCGDKRVVLCFCFLVTFCNTFDISLKNSLRLIFVSQACVPWLQKEENVVL